MPSPPSAPPIRALRVRALVHRGVIEAHGLLVGEALAGPLEARRRVVAAWAPGVTVHRLEAAGGLLVRFPSPRWIDCARAPGLPLVRAGASPAAPIASAPLTAREVEALAPPPKAVVVVRGGEPVFVVPSPADVEDPASYLDASGFAPVPVVALGPSPPLPRLVTEPNDVPPRLLLGMGQAPDQVADVLAALRAARRGEVLADAEVRRPPLFGARMLSALRAFFSGLFARRGRVRALPAGGTPGRALVVVPAPPPSSGPTFLQRAGSALRSFFAKALVRADLAPYLGRRQAEYVGKMIDLFDQGDLAEALRHAIPLGNEEGGGEGGEARRPLLGVPTPRDQLAIFGQGGGSGGAGLFTPDDFYEDLRRRYRAAFERLEREGRIEEAAFVLAELLHQSAEAVAFLERHERFRLAAEIAEARGLPPALLVRQWLLAGDATRAVLLARRHGAFADALAKLGDHAQAPVLRLLWAGMLAEAGDFAAAVDVAWPVAGGRPTAEAWIDAAIAQGGAPAARMLARKLSLVPGSFPDVRERALALLDDDEGAHEGAAVERRAFAEGLLAEGASPGARVLARPAIRALVRDGSRSAEAAPRLLVERLEAFAGDDALRADRPGWPIVERPPFSSASDVRKIVIAGWDSGATAVHDAAHLPNGRTVLALGEAGVRVLARGGRPLFDLDQPAHRLVVSDRGDRALALARRGDAFRVARLDLVGRRTEVWCEARFDCTAPTFDGSQWVVAQGSRLLVIDALEKRFDALASFDIGEAGARSIARTAHLCAVAVTEQDASLTRVRYDLPSWTLRQRSTIQTPWRPHAVRPVLAAGTTGAVAILVGPRDLLERQDPMLLCSVENGSPLSIHLDAPAHTAPAALEVAPGWIAAALRTGTRADVRLVSVGKEETRAQIVLIGAGEISLRLGPGDTLTVADDRGRVLVMELAHGGTLVDARV